MLIFAKLLFQNSKFENDKCQILDNCAAAAFAEIKNGNHYNSSLNKTGR